MVKFFQTSENDPMKPGYWGELFGLQLGLKDKEGNLLSFHKADYKKFMSIVKNKGWEIKKLTPAEMLDIIMAHNKSAPSEKSISMIKYLSPEVLKSLELSLHQLDFRSEGSIKTIGGTVLQKENHQNCLVMLHNGTIYVHPKVRANAAENIMAINHSSLAKGNTVQFAGSFFHDEAIGWVLENTSGHYGTRATNMRSFLVRLQEKGVSLQDLTIKLWTPKIPDAPGSCEYHIIMENAAHFVQRTTKSINYNAP